MNPKLIRIVAPLLVVCFAQLACYNSYRVTNAELEHLTSANIAPRVTIETDEGPVEIRATSPIEVVDASGDRHGVSPFNFTFDENGLIAPDYDLFLARDDVDGARVFEFAKGRTIGLIVGSIVVAGGAFAAVSLLAGEDAGPGGN